MQVQDKKSKTTQKTSSDKSAVSRLAMFEQCQDVRSMLKSQRHAGDQVEKQVKHNLPGVNSSIPPSLKTGLEALSGMDLSHVRVYSNSSKPAQYDALAYAQGNNIHLGPGQEKQLPHEGWHIVQQMQGRVRPVTQTNRGRINEDSKLEQEADVMGIKALQNNLARQSKNNTNVLHTSTQTVMQRRRVPGVTDILDLVWEENAAAHATGLREIVRRAWAELTTAQRTAVGRRVLRSYTHAELSALSQAYRDIFFAHAIRQEIPCLIHGDPSLYQVGVRTGSNDAANITSLVNGANTIFSAIASGSHDTSIGQIFGAGNITTAKNRYAAARVRMNLLKTQNKIVTDRSGYSGEVGLGGLTNSAQIMVSFETIDNPGRKESVVTMIHEAMHAITASLIWVISIERTFTACRKLTNSIMPHTMKSFPAEYW